jgi:hypothetical protein
MKYLTMAELCETLQVHRNTITIRCKKGMPHFTIGRDKRFDLEKVIEWLENQPPSKSPETRKPPKTKKKTKKAKVRVDAESTDDILNEFEKWK